MRVLIYGGSFNPPHLGHESALQSAAAALHPEKILVIPAGMPPHKQLAEGSPGAEGRLRLSQLAFEDQEGAEVLDLELVRLGKSYTVDTIREIGDRYEDAELYFLVGTDMLMSMENWYEFDQILSECVLVALPRCEGDYPQMEIMARHLRETYGARITLIRKVPLEMNSTELRAGLHERQGCGKLSDPVYSEIIRRRYYNAKPDLAWLRGKAYPMLKPSRVAHVQGTEQTAAALAERWGEDGGDAAEAAILHDITKKLSPEEQLRLYEKYDIMTNAAERREPKLYHARTGAYLARDLFGVSDAVADAIEWHTTGRVGMSTLEKIIYLADFIEPNRDFPGVETVRALAFEDLDQAMIAALRLSMIEVSSHGTPHPRSVQTLEWLEKGE